MRSKLICPQCQRRLCTYTITRRRSPRAAIGYRYYRCRSTVGGRAPCRGVQFPAYKIEEAARDALGDPQTWQTMIDAGVGLTTDRADLLAALWTGLDIPTQERLLSQIIESIEFSRRNSEMRITFADDFVDTLMPVIAGLAEDTR